MSTISTGIEFKEILSAREVEVIYKMTEGKIIKEIAEELFVSINTIKFHKKNIMRKSNCRNNAELVMKCICAGVIKIERYA